jgi:hypothetical protein
VNLGVLTRRMGSWGCNGGMLRSLALGFYVLLDCPGSVRDVDMSLVKDVN